MRIEFVAAPAVEELAGAIVAMAFEDGLSPAAGAIDKASGGALSRAVSSGRFKGRNRRNRPRQPVENQH